MSEVIKLDYFYGEEGEMQMANENVRKIPLKDIYELPGVTLPERPTSPMAGLSAVFRPLA